MGVRVSAKDIVSWQPTGNAEKPLAVLITPLDKSPWRALLSALATAVADVARTVPGAYVLRGKHV
jgi:hypothetical protein